jgi:hypothetical protein
LLAAAVITVVGMVGAVAVTGSAFAEEAAEPCPTASLDVDAEAIYEAATHSLILTVFALGCPKATMQVKGKLVQNGTVLFVRDPVTCASARDCRIYDKKDCQCWWGWLQWIGEARRGSGAWVADTAWVYVPGG